MRGNGVLAHVTSLPSQYGIGDIGYSSYWFVDILHSMEQTYWQILPLNPIEKLYEFSPYSSESAFAGNILLISPELLFEDGFISKKDLEPDTQFSLTKTDYENSSIYKLKLLEISFDNFLKFRKKKEYFEEFCEKEKYWLEDYSIFKVLKKIFKNLPWNKWDSELIERKIDAIEDLRKGKSQEILKEKFFQFIFFNQWARLKDYCKIKEIKIIGDIPIYVIFDSVDVWANKEIFKLRNNKPEFVSGVPPDNFSSYGQLWGHPVYNWDILMKRDFTWWILRLQHSSKLFDIIRIDHFRGFESYWEVPYGEKTAGNGRWVKAPGEDFLKKIFARLSSLTLIAEDLGGYTEPVQRLLKIFNIPGTRVLHFAFSDGNPDNPYLPHNYEKNCVVYTGTHDNNTSKSWFERDLDEKVRRRIIDYLGKEVSSENINWELIRLAMQSVANISIIPMQDILGLSEEGRMNKPATIGGNWRWRFAKEDVKEEFMVKFKEMTEMYGRG